MKNKSTPWLTCPVVPFTTKVLASASELNLALKRLRRAMHHCESCPNSVDCPILADFNSKFNTALQQITDEWGLS